MVKWTFPGSLYFESTRKNFKSNLVLVVVLELFVFLQKVIIPRSLSHKAKQARSNSNIPRYLTHKAKQARWG